MYILRGSSRHDLGKCEQVDYETLVNKERSIWQVDISLPTIFREKLRKKLDKSGMSLRWFMNQVCFIVYTVHGRGLFWYSHSQYYRPPPHDHSSLFLERSKSACRNCVVCINDSAPLREMVEKGNNIKNCNSDFVQFHFLISQIRFLFFLSIKYSTNTTILINSRSIDIFIKIQLHQILRIIT